MELLRPKGKNFSPFPSLKKFALELGTTADTEPFGPKAGCPFPDLRALLLEMYELGSSESSPLESVTLGDLANAEVPNIPQDMAFKLNRDLLAPVFGISSRLNLHFGTRAKVIPCLNT